MAIWTQKSKILPLIIQIVAVDVIYLQRQRLTIPFGSLTAFNAHFWDTYLQQNPSQNVCFFLVTTLRFATKHLVRCLTSI